MQAEHDCKKRAGKESGHVPVLSRLSFCLTVIHSAVLPQDSVWMPFWTVPRLQSDSGEYTAQSATDLHRAGETPGSLPVPPGSG